jgi:hypothetical protein
VERTGTRIHLAEGLRHTAVKDGNSIRPENVCLA